MLFTVSAAIRFNAKPVVECALRSSPKLAQKTKLLVQELRRLEAKDIRKQLHVNEALSRQYEEGLKTFESQQPVPACCLYDSPLFRSFDAAGLDKEDAEYANKHVRIYSGLYGVIRPFDEIQPLGLPVTLATKLKTSKGNFLREFWREHVTKQLEEDLLRLPIPVIIDCSNEAEEETVPYDEEGLPKGLKVTKIGFKLGSKEANAESMGTFLRWAIERRVQSLEEVLEYRGFVDDDEPAEFRINPKASKDDTIVFEEAKGEGSDAGWGNKLAESGLSNRAFQKQEMSGKNKYLRTEFKKAMSVDKKRASKATKVF